MNNNNNNNNRPPEYNPAMGNENTRNPYYELPPNEEDLDNGRIFLEERTGLDTKGRYHLYYVYKVHPSQDERMSIGNDDFLDINFNDNEYVKASKRFFIGERDFLQFKNLHRRRMAREGGEDPNDPVEEFPETPQAVNEQQTDEERSRLELMNQKIRLYHLKIKNRPTLTNRLDLYKTTRNLMSIYDKTEDRSLIKELLIQMNQLVNNVIDEDLQKQDVVNAGKQAELAAKQAARRGPVLVPATPDPPLTPQRNPAALVLETPPHRMGHDFVAPTPGHQREEIFVPPTPNDASNEPPTRIPRLNSMDGGSRRTKSIRKNKKTLKSSNKLKKTNKKTRKVK